MTGLSLAGTIIGIGLLLAAVFTARRRWLCAAALTVGLFLIFIASPFGVLADSKYSFLQSDTLLTRGDWRLEERFPHLREAKLEDPGTYYHLIYLHDRNLHYTYPPGASLLQVPIVGALRLVGVSVIDERGEYDMETDRQIQRWVAAALMAALGLVFLCTANLLLPSRWAVGAAILGCLGTNVWSELSRVVWIDTWGALLLALGIFILTRSLVSDRSSLPVLLATILSWAFFVKPTYAFPAATIAALLLLRRRREGLILAAVGAVWALLFVGFSQWVYGQWLPDYYLRGTQRMGEGAFASGLAGVLVSPSRGLLIFVPWLWAAGFVVLRWPRRVPVPALAVLAVINLAILAATFAEWDVWWGGHGYGPRLFAGSTPWMVLLGIQAAAAWRGAPPSTSRRVAVILSIALLLLALFIHARGAWSSAVRHWNAAPANIDTHTERIWDWGDPQWLAGLLPQPPVSAYPSLAVGERLAVGYDESAQHLGSGWSFAEAQHRWTEGRRAWIAFARLATGERSLALAVTPLISGDELPRQRVRALLNGAEVSAFELTENRVYEVVIPLPAEHLRDENTLMLDLPDATPPSRFDWSEDPRRVALAVQWIELR